MPKVSSRSRINIVGWQVLDLILPVQCGAPVRPGSPSTCTKPAVKNLRYHHQGPQGKIVTCHEAQCAEHLHQWHQAFGSPKTLSGD